MEKRCARTARSAPAISRPMRKSGAILTAEGQKQASVLRAPGVREATSLEAEASATRSAPFRGLIHAGNPIRSNFLLAYQYGQALPLSRRRLEQVWIIPADFHCALVHIGATRTRTRSSEGEPCCG